MGDDAPKILLVGHCGPDSFALRSAVWSAVDGADVKMIADRATLDREAGSAALCLVNRVLDGSFGTPNGIELIRMLARGGGPALMLISNYEDAQTDAERAGALPGFGTADMRSETAAERIRRAVAGPATTPGQESDGDAP